MDSDLKTKKNLIDNLTIGIAVTNQQGQILFVNQAIKKMTGYTEAEIKNMEDWFKKAYPNRKDRNKAKEFFQYDIENNISDRTYKIKTAAGDYKYLNFRQSRLEAGQNLFEIIDISNKIKEKQELETKKIIFKNLFTNSLEAIAFLDKNLNILNINKRFEEIFNISKQNIMNKSVLDVLNFSENYKNSNQEMKKILKNEYWEDQLKFKVDNQIKYFNVHIFSVENQIHEKLIYLAVDDITESKKRAKELKEVKKRLELAVAGANIGIWDWDLEKEYIHFNNNWAEMLGYQVSELNNNADTWLDLVHPDDKDGALKDLNQHLEGKTEIFLNEHRLKTKSGAWKWVRDIGKVTEKNDKGKAVRVVGVHIDIDKEKRVTKEKEYLSNHDELTGLYNRRYFNEEIRRLYDSRRYPISIIVGDLNKLKNINDNYGHIMGDKYIKAAAEAIKESLRTEDLVARIGGDEFALILPETDEKSVETVTRRILENIEKKNKESALPEKLSIALGYETSDFNEQKSSFKNIMECFHKADQKMYENKFANDFIIRKQS